jgi:hypothetical protein
VDDVVEGVVQVDTPHVRGSGDRWWGWCLRAGADRAHDEEVDRGLAAVAAMNLLGLLTALLSAQGASWSTTMRAVASSPAYGGAAPAVRGVKS